MEKIDSITFKKIITNAGIAFIGLSTKESMNYMPYGCKIRDNLYSKAMDLLNKGNYEKVILSDFVNPELLVNIDQVSKISGGYMKIKDHNLMIAAGHEVNAYNYFKELLKNNYDIKLPLRIYNFGPVFRDNKNTKFPFNLGERKSFLECYAIFKTTEEAERELDFATNWNRKVIRDTFHIPSVEVIRPVSTNKKISKRTICLDSITPLDETVITGMTYFHNDIFTRALDLKYKDQVLNKNKITYSVHFGLSENILFSYLLNSCDGENLRLLSFIAPIQVSVVNAVNNNNYKNVASTIVKKLETKGIKCQLVDISRNKISSNVKNNRLKGIPITLIIKNEFDKLELHLQHFDESDLFETENNKVDYKNLLNKINELLEINDQTIINDMQQREKETIVECDDITKLNNLLEDGKVVKVHLLHNEDSVHNIESKISCGEVLGFSPYKEKGKDILTNDDVENVAYISRRS